MEKDQLLSELEELLQRLDGDVIPQIRSDYLLGVERWNSWVRLARRFFESNLPNYINSFKVRSDARTRVNLGKESIGERFIRLPIMPMKAFLKSLIRDVNQGDLISSLSSCGDMKQVSINMLRKAFIVHGHDDSTKLRTARFLEKLSFEAVILHEQASGGKTIIEKLEHFTDVGFGIVLYTPDDIGEALANQANLRPRARQNVVFEHGLLLGKLGRERVLPLVTDHSVELPGDISGMVYMSDRNWEIDLAKEIKALGYGVDLNSLF